LAARIAAVVAPTAEAVMQTPSPWATKADVEAAREALKADIDALHANQVAMHRDLRAVQALLTELRDRRLWWRWLRWALRRKR
jgi:hypothetical protein